MGMCILSDGLFFLLCYAMCLFYEIDDGRIGRNMYWKTFKN
jgi:hypothetical protein